MEKLSAFFEKVERLIESGTSAPEVGFKMAFSKAELRKVSGVRDGVVHCCNHTNAIAATSGHYCTADINGGVCGVVVRCCNYINALAATC